MRTKRKISKEKRSLQIISNSHSFPYIEAYKMLRTNLKFITGANNAKVMAVTSAIPMEGKTNVIINLAITLAEMGKKVLLIDGDMRKPMIHKYLEIPNASRGLSNVLSRTYEWNTVAVRFKELPLYVLPSGPIPPNPTELVGSSSMEQLIATVRGEFDYVLIDTPPVSVVADAVTLSNSIDGVLLVVRHKYTKVDVVKAAKKNIESAGVNVLGVIMNMFEIKHANRAYDYYKSYAYEYES
ncbi:MAG: CpsD/CapB family tyrosine-protein kinase [Eubacteriales bacterium]